MESALPPPGSPSEASRKTTNAPVPPLTEAEFGRMPRALRRKHCHNFALTPAWIFVMLRLPLRLPPPAT